MWLRAVLTVARRGPGPFLVAASFAGWTTLAWLLNADWVQHSAPAMGHHAHDSVSRAAATVRSSGGFIVMWLAMILAMAPPLLLREIGRLWRTSLRRSRPLVVASFLSGYVAVWLTAGILCGMLAHWLTASVVRTFLAVAAAALWHCSPARQRCLNACHRVPALRVFGTAAQWDAGRYGVSTGGYCVGSCGLAMLLVLLATEAHLAAVAIVTGAAIVERYLPARQPRWRLPFARHASDWPGVRVAIRPAA